MNFNTFEESIQQIKEKLDEGLFPQWAVTDENIYKLEMENIFSKTWQYLGHETELKEPGNYITRWIVNDPILLTKTKKNEVKAFLNSCSHRGVQLCTAASGKSNRFTCPYHGWTFNLEGDLVGVVAGNKVYGESLDKEEWGLRPVPRVSTYKGLIFGNLDPDAMPLEEFLGEYKWYLDIILERSDGGMEVRGVPQRWVVDANWKLLAENFMDPYHAQTAHRSTVELGMSPKDPLYASYGHAVSCEHGHGICLIEKGKDMDIKYQGLPEEMWPMFEKNLSDDKLGIFSKSVVNLGTLFPNLSFNSPLHGNEGHLYNYLTLRVWRPLGPEKCEVISWFLIDKNAPAEYKEGAYKAYVGSFGPSGTLEQDDTEIWTRVIQASKGFMARDKSLNYNNFMNYLMGDDVKPDESFPGPGKAYPTNYVDHLDRAFQRYWFELISAKSRELIEK